MTESTKGSAWRADLAAHNQKEASKSPGRYSEWMLVNCVIDPRDEIYEFFATHALAANPIREYLSDGWRTLNELIIVLESVDRSLLKMRSVLEFAAGFGRFTRHLARLLPDRLAVSDVQPGSVDFLRDQFGARGFYSTHDPASLAFPERYELVFVLSMFTHLPPPHWKAWLQALYAAVAPGGVLVFSVHNEARGRGLGVSFDTDGIHFIPSSESRELTPETYGTTFTTRDFVRRAVQDALPGQPVEFRDIAFWDGQDAVIVQRPR